MKVQIIQLEPEDDFASTRDHLNWTKAEKAVLVWPRSGRPLARALDLKLVQRHAQRRGIELALICFDPDLVRSAARAGLPVFESLDQLPGGQWQQSTPPQTTVQQRDPQRLDELRQARDAAGPITAMRLDSRGRTLAVAAVGVAILAVAAAVIPGAEVRITPTASTLETSLELTLDPDLSSALGDGRLPGLPVTTQVSGQMQVETTGRVRTPAAAATGQVEFTSLTDKPLTIPSGTGLRAGEVRFLTTEELELDGDSGSVEVVAAEAGRSGNVAAGEIDSVEGSLGFLVQATNPLATRGGQEVLAGAVSEDDRQRLQSALMDELLESGAAALIDQLESGRGLAAGTVSVLQIVEQEFDREAGEVAEQLSLRITLEVEGLSFDLEQAEQAIAARLAAAVPQGRFVVPGTLVFSPDEAELVDGSAVIDFRVKAEEAHDIDLGAVRQAARGATAATIGNLLRNQFRLAEPAQVDLSPAWLPWMPLLEMRIEVDWAWSEGG